MEYKKLKPHKMPEGSREEELRELWKNEYCEKPIVTPDNVKVYFYEDMFDHCFYESASRIEGDKSILSLNRLEKMLWIKDALQDKTAVLKKAWNRNKKRLDTDRRVAIVKGNYIVIIRFTGLLKAKLVTAYYKEDIDIVLANPDFEKTEKYFGKV